MRDIKELCGIIEDELGKIAEKGLNTGNLDTAYKLIDMYKDIKNTEYWSTKADYYEAVLSEMQSGYSEDEGYGYSSKRDKRGRYSRTDGRMMPDYDRDSSYARRGEHYVKGHYSRSDGSTAYDGYMNEKQSYRTGGKSEDCKRRMLAALEEHLDTVTDELGEMSRDADCREERETIKKYVEKLRNMM